MNSAAVLEANVQIHVSPPQAVMKVPKRVMVKNVQGILGRAIPRQEQKIFPRSHATNASKKATVRTNALTRRSMAVAKVRKVVAEAIADEDPLLRADSPRLQVLMLALHQAKHPATRPREVQEFAISTSHGPIHPRCAITVPLVHSSMQMKGLPKPRLVEPSACFSMSPCQIVPIMFQ